MSGAGGRGFPSGASAGASGSRSGGPPRLPEPAAAFTLLLVGAFALLLRFPQINDVTTTPADPPSFHSAPPGDVPYPAVFVDSQRRAYPDLAPLATGREPAETFALTSRAAREMPGWEVVFEDDSLRVLQAVATTRLLGSSDDVVIEVRPEADGSAVHVRSRSRLGRADFGTNARRIRAYLRLLE